MSYFIEKDGSVFVFHGFTAQNLFGKYQGAFETSMKGFAPLTDRQKLNVKPDRIHIRKVERQMTLEQALRAFNAPDDKLNELSLMNGMELSVNLEKGMLIKTIDK